jgi:hypothetical protein
MKSEQWYNRQTALKLIQGYGRSIYPRRIAQCNSTATHINVRVCFMSNGEINREALREIYPTSTLSYLYYQQRYRSKLIKCFVRIEYSFRLFFTVHTVLSSLDNDQLSVILIATIKASDTSSASDRVSIVFIIVPPTSRSRARIRPFPT